MTAQMSRLQTPFSFERMVEMSGPHFGDSAPNVICNTLVGPRYKQQRDMNVSWKTVTLDNIRVHYGLELPLRIITVDADCHYDRSDLTQ